MLDIFGLHISTRKLIGSAVYLLLIFAVYLALRRILKVAFTRASKNAAEDAAANAKGTKAVKTTKAGLLKRKQLTKAQRQRIKTVSQMLSSVLKYLMIILTILVVLADLGVNVSSLIAGLGILTAVVGLAFQDMIKDLIAGVTILVEEQFGVGDTVMIDGFKGTVISIGLRTTEIRNNSGEVKIIANHNVDGLINYNKPEETKK